MNRHTALVTIAALVVLLRPIRRGRFNSAGSCCLTAELSTWCRWNRSCSIRFGRMDSPAMCPPVLQRDLRRIRITVGNKKLPNEGDVSGPRNNTPNSPAGPTATAEPAASNTNPSVLDRLKSVMVAPWEKPASKPAPAESGQATSGQAASTPLDLPPPPINEEQAKTSALPMANEMQAKTKPPAHKAPRPLSSLPFFQSGQVSKIDNGKSSDESQTSTPRLNENEGAPESQRTFESDRMSMSAKPAVLETPVGGGPPPNSGTIAKPWLPLMGALLALFASLGANVYLAWIHQSVRLKYRTLAARMGSSAAGA